MGGQQQQQQQGQFMSSNFPPFPPFPSIPYPDERSSNYPPPHVSYTSAQSSNHPSERYSSSGSHFEGGEGHNKVSYERNGNQAQYASYPRDAVYRHASGPGWQQQEVFYPPRSSK